MCFRINKPVRDRRVQEPAPRSELAVCRWRNCGQPRPTALSGLAKISCRKGGCIVPVRCACVRKFFQEQSQEVQWNQQIDLKMGQNKANFGGRMLWNHVTSPIGLQAGRVS